MRISEWSSDVCSSDRAYIALHRLGFAHSVECYDQDGHLVGGLYGVRLGAAFFGESMFSRQAEASKVALVHLVARLRAGGFTLLETRSAERRGGKECVGSCGSRWCAVH